MSERPRMSFMQQSRWIYEEAASTPGLTIEQRLLLAERIIRTPGLEPESEVSPAVNITFTPAEKRLAAALVEEAGLTNKELARRFSCSAQTIKNHLTEIRIKIRSSDSYANVNSRITLYFWLKDNFVRS